jgi:hypothetical protein
VKCGGSPADGDRRAQLISCVEDSDTVLFGEWGISYMGVWGDMPIGRGMVYPMCRMAAQGITCSDGCHALGLGPLPECVM